MGSHKARGLNNIEVTDVHKGTAQAGDYIAIDETAKFNCVLFEQTAQAWSCQTF
jgi:hypothetical protein